MSTTDFSNVHQFKVEEKEGAELRHTTDTHKVAETKSCVCVEQNSAGTENNNSLGNKSVLL